MATSFKAKTKFADWLQHDKTMHQNIKDRRYGILRCNNKQVDVMPQHSKFDAACAIKSVTQRKNRNGPTSYARIHKVTVPRIKTTCTL